jgi:ABC-type nitrate/sulfonate/bicarbonate transport system ATPase subunit
MIKIFINNYSYENKIPVIRNINFSLQEGKISSLIGASGCGKSTFLRVLMGMEIGAIGKITFQNKDFSLQKWDTNQKIFSMVPQIPHLFPWKNILDNITIAISDAKMKTEQKSREEIALEVLKIVQMESHIKKYPDEISLGMAQRVSFARALVLDTKAILLDEPFASLDAHTRYILQEWLANKILETNKYAILVTHDVREALSLSNEIHVLSGFPAEIKKTYAKIDIDISDHISKEKEIINLIGEKII